MWMASMRRWWRDAVREVCRGLGWRWKSGDGEVRANSKILFRISAGRRSRRDVVAGTGTGKEEDMVGGGNCNVGN
jgi:hypothetical protein